LCTKLHNRISFGINNSIMGHGLLIYNDNDHIILENNDDDDDEQRLLHGKSIPSKSSAARRINNNYRSTNILSNLFSRSYHPLSSSSTVKPSSTSSSSTSLNIKQYIHSGRHYNISNTVELSTSSSSSSSNNSNNNNSCEICCMSFDNDGILLATGDDRGIIRIYDFDDVYSLDVTKRNEICKVLLKSEEEENDEKKKKEKVEDDNDVDGETTSKGNVNEESDNSDVSAYITEQRPVSNTISPSVVGPVLTFQCKTNRGGNVGPRISSVEWSPANQDHVAVSFA